MNNTTFYIVRSVSAVAKTSHPIGHKLTDGGQGFATQEKAQQVADMYNRFAANGVSYSLLACNDGMDCGMQAI